MHQLMIPLSPPLSVSAPNISIVLPIYDLFPATHTLLLHAFVPAPGSDSAPPTFSSPPPSFPTPQPPPPPFSPRPPPPPPPLTPVLELVPLLVEAGDASPLSLTPAHLTLSPPRSTNIGAQIPIFTIDIMPVQRLASKHGVPLRRWGSRDFQHMSHDVTFP